MTIQLLTRVPGFDVQVFNASGNVQCATLIKKSSDVLKEARLTFQKGCGIAINGIDCFTFAEVERVIKHYEPISAEVNA